MARPRSPKRKEAETLYKKGMRLCDIAKEIGIGASTVRRWKAEDGWKQKPKKKNPEKKNVPDARIGNKNAVGNSGNKNPVGPVKHGGYKKVYFDKLSPEEEKMIEEMDTDVESLLIQQIQLLTIRERRLMHAIKKYMDEGPLYIAMTSDEKNVRTFKNPEEEEQYEEIIRRKIASGERMPGENSKIITQAQATEDLINRLRKELTSVQSQKIKAITALQQYRQHEEEMKAMESGNNAVDDWIMAVIGKNI